MENKYKRTDKLVIRELNLGRDGQLNLKKEVYRRNYGILFKNFALVDQKKNTRVTTLDLKDTGLGAQGGKYVAAMLLENDFLYTVDLSQNRLGAEGAKAVGEVIRLNRSLINMVLSGNNFCDTGIEFIATPLQINDQLVELDLSDNKVEFAGQALGTAMSTNTSLETLNLSWNSLRGTGAVSFFKGLQSNRCLTHLDLSCNGLGYEGSLGLGKMLKINRSLKFLDVSNNNITWHGAIMVADGLRKNIILDTLRIGENPLTTTGCQDILDAVSEKTCQLKYLSLKQVPVIGEFEMMAMAIRQSRAFNYEHGGIVNSHDILGQRLNRRIDPMEKVLQYMKERGLRATELFRTFDKSVSNKLGHQTFIDRLKLAGVDMPKYELEELLVQIQRRGSRANAGDSIDYKKLSKTVHEHQERERLRQIKVRERAKKVEEYHKKILESGTIQDVTESEVYDIFADDKSFSSLLSELKALKASGSQASARSTPTILPQLKIDARRGNSHSLQINSSQTHTKSLMSMSTALGAKPKVFGTADVKKKRKSSKRKKLRSRTAKKN